MTRKIAISVPDASLRKVHAAVRAGRAANVSNYIVRLIEDASAAETFDEMLAAWIAESGATDAEIRAADRESLEAFERAGFSPRRARHDKRAKKVG